MLVREPRSGRQRHDRAHSGAALTLTTVNTPVPHIRTISGTPDVIEAYRAAQHAVCAGRNPMSELRQVLSLDPGCVVALSDVAALEGEPRNGPAAGTKWERQHLEVVETALIDVPRAEGMLREHAIQHGCDPVALYVIAQHVDGLDGARLVDLRGSACNCVAPSRDEPRR